MEWSCPAWFSAPRGPEQLEAPVSFDTGLPKHLRPYQAKYRLPGWLVYGVVRCLGSEEFLAQGVCRTYRVRDETGEDQLIVDDTWYDVSPPRIEEALAAIAADSAAAATERDRQDVIGRHVKRRYGSYVLLSMNASDMVQYTGNLLQQSGQSDDRMEKFVRGQKDRIPQPGWKETSREYQVTGAGVFRYGDPIGSFRKTEEDAIQELAKCLVLKLSHMEKTYTPEGREDGSDEVVEETNREEIRLRMKGLRVIRRAVDLEQGTCVVTVSVPRNGVARN